MTLLGKAEARQRKQAGLSSKGNGRAVYKVDLPSYHADCDANYLRLIRLLPGLPERVLWRYQLPAGTLILSIAAHSRYTTEVSLGAEVSPGACRWLESPDLTVRLYHDARMAEVITANGCGPLGGKGTDAIYPNPRMQRADERPQTNRFLAEWLDYCLANASAEFDLVLDGRRF
ncbi:DUF1249 domain-containing protein [uncultured Microbulbifer sp.]|uniref:DUF1249 domain-containing protein n=1 Tax=uncultured Microbulbifer sp. TaxID=348147 RepID=UPI00262241EC|nr:DUF1249 domain-containing protein [uncultured Microbulbifer sp.]